MRLKTTKTFNPDYHQDYYYRNKAQPLPKSRVTYTDVYLPKQLHFSSPMLLGDYVRKKIVERGEIEMSLCKVLVKDGKLTPEGIKAGIKL